MATDLTQALVSRCFSTVSGLKSDQAYRVFNDSINRNYQTNGYFNGRPIVYFDFKDLYASLPIITGAKISMNDNSNNSIQYNPTTFDFVGSNVVGTWVSAFHYSRSSQWDASSDQTFSFTDAVAYRYFGIRVIDCYGDTDNRTTIPQMELYGQLGSSQKPQSNSGGN